MENEVTLLDLLWALRRAFLRLLLLALGVGLGVYALSLLLPKRYESAALLWLDLRPFPSQEALRPFPSQEALRPFPSQEALSPDQPLTSPPLASLVQALDLSLPTLRLSPAGEPASRFAQVEWDAKAQVLSLRAFGATPEEAQRRATKLLEEARSFLQARVREAYGGLAAAELARAEKALGLLEKALQEEVPQVSSRGSADPAPFLEAQGTPPPVARAQDPAATYLALKRAELLAEASRLQAQVAWLRDLLAQDGTWDRFLAESVLLSPTLPERPLAPRPLAYGVLAALGALLLGVLWVFLATVLRPGGAGVPQSDA